MCILCTKEVEVRESKTQIKYWQAYSETLLIKICFHAFTIHQIFSGHVLKSNYYTKELNNKIVIDRASAIVLLRSQFFPIGWCVTNRKTALQLVN